MEALSQLQSAAKVIESVKNMVKGDKELEDNLKNDLEAIKCELTMVSREVEVDLAKNNQDSKPPEWILQLQDLAYEIEDFLEDLGRNPRASRSSRLFQLASTMVMDPRPEHLRRIQHFKTRITRIREGAAATPSPSTNGRSTSSPPLDTPVAQQLVGTELPKRELAHLLISTAGGHQNELKVISILGCGGSGKTTLARALQEDPSVVQHFHYRAIVEAPSGSDPPAVITTVKRILQQLGRVGEEGNAGDDHRHQLEILRHFLCDKRYLVIIDGVQEIEAWDAISQAFPDNKQGSRIVVTTSIRSVATGCSSGSYVYAMRGLGGTESENLFWSKLGHEHRAPALADGLETFFAKCDGLPILLVETAESLRHHGAALTYIQCKDVGDALGNHLAGEDPAFSETRRALTQCCGSLREHCQKMCMLSLSSFPRGRKINTKSLLRRWIAEGLVVSDVQLDEDRVARDCMDKLLDLGIVEPGPSSGTTSNSRCSKVRCCQVRSVMLEFLVHRSISWNFITIIDSGRVFRNQTACSVRRLSIYGSGNHQAAQKIEPSGIRSLTIRNTSSKSGGRLTSLDNGTEFQSLPSEDEDDTQVSGRLTLELKKCKVLRVLDLEGCTWFGNDHFHVICGLLHLKYVSLRRTKVSKIPRPIGHLHCLETLDVRDTDVCDLPMQVLLLPQLAHLFGEFKLPAQLGDAKSKKAEKLRRFLSDESKLQTLSGFKIVNNGGFELILRHAKMLRKVKIWCECDALAEPTHHPLPPTTKPWSAFRNPIRALPLANRLLRYACERDPLDLPKSLVSSVQYRSAGSDALDSLSIDFGSSSLCTDFLDSVLKDPCAVTDIKVSGEMEKLPGPQTLTQLRNVKELHLCNTGLPSEALSVLQNLVCLVSLKLEENHQGYWEGTFVVEEPAEDLAVTGIAHLPHLNEIILHPGALQAKIRAWEDAAAKHKNRPYVKKQPDETHQKKKQPDGV